MLNFLLFVIVFVAIITFTGNFKAIKLTMDCYQHSRKIVEYINDYTYTPHSIYMTRLKMTDWLGLELPTKKLKIGIIERICLRVYNLEFSRIIVEQKTIINWFILPDEYRKTIMRWNELKISIFVEKMRKDIKDTKIPLTEIEEMYCLYKLNIKIGKLVGVSELQAYIVKPIYDELFKKLDKTKINKINFNEIAIKYIPKNKQGKKTLRYATSLTFKTIYFLHPQFSQNKLVKEFTFTSF